MHILYIHQYFATPRGNTGTRSYEFARRWVAAGHRVTMLTSTAQLVDADLARATGRCIRRFSVAGIDVLALNVPYHQTMRFARRLASFSAFMVAVSWMAVFRPGVDVVYATSTPLTIGVPALACKWLRRRPYIFEVRDVWPAVPIAMGYIRNPLLIRLFNGFERLVYRHADAIVALSAGMANCVRRAAPPDKPVATITNCSDLDHFRPDVDGKAVRAAHGWQDCVVCMHIGTMGPVNGLDAVLRAARHFRLDQRLRFALVGEGSEKKPLRAQKEAEDLANLQVLDGVPKQNLPTMFAAADVCLVTFANIPILRDNSANKFFDSLSAGKPVLVNSDGWQQALLEACGAGLGSVQGDDASFFEHIARLAADAPLRERMGNAARRLAETRFARDMLAARALEVIERSRPIPSD